MSSFEPAGTHRRLHGLRGSADMFHLAGIGGPTVVVTADVADIDKIIGAYLTFRPAARALALPPLDASPLSFSPIHASTRRMRLLCFDAILRDDWDLIVTLPQVLLEALAPEENLLAPLLCLRAGARYDLTELSRKLVQMGYQAADMVGQPGDFASRGGILDIYSFVDETAFRLDFFDDELEEIRIFDPSTQRSNKYVDEVRLLPLYEWVVGQRELETFAVIGGDLWNQTPSRGQFLELVAQIRDRGRFAGYLHWAGVFFKSTRHLYDLLPAETTWFIDDWTAVEEHQENYLSHLELQYEALDSGGQVRAAPRTLFGSDHPRRIPLPEGAVVLSHRHLKLAETDEDFVTQSVPHYDNDVARFFSHWEAQAKRLAVVLVCRTPGMMRRLEEHIDESGHPAHTLVFPLEGALVPGFYLAEGHLHTGFSWPDLDLVVISESDIFAAPQKARHKISGKTFFHAEFRDLKIGDLVVHLDHGVGKFLGLVEMEAGGARHEMMALEYHDRQKLYVNLNQLDLVQRYGQAGPQVHLDRLGGISWAKTRGRIKKALREMAAELIALYASRSVLAGRSYGPDTEWQREFEDAFEYDPTDGQLTAAADIKCDLESGRPMDRLLVGDVGFGKTEVAMRMAFKAVMEGFQVAVLCPTTVLVFQHFHTFRERFAAFPVRIGQISRFTSAPEAKKALRQLAEGQIDIIIGTHRLLSKDVQFQKLGALIIDEEQRFGVGHKEHLKQLRKQLDVLSMSATPIPRTLNMSLSGIRDISVIETPPRNRLAISTTVAEAREGLIKNAIAFELERGGQVFFIHNRIDTMATVATNIKKLVPDARVAMAHGQMESHTIERTMLSFMKREIDILIASTIIENGVDIPNANTMLINRADMFGMSQLYQLRGRIGRSDRPAYAYLLVPPKARMTALARKRLATLEEFSDLGAGFRIAAMDMELRGAGNMLGGEQAGHINAIGYETYIKLLEEAVNELKGRDLADDIHCVVKLNLGAAIPKSYIEDTNQRLHHYKKLAAARTEAEIDAIAETMADMFGAPPTNVEVLCAEHRLRIYLASLRILSAERERGRLNLRFHEKAAVDSEMVLRWVTEARDIQVSPEGMISLPISAREPTGIMDFIHSTATALTGSGEARVAETGARVE